jgi:hypothetical protein
MGAQPTTSTAIHHLRSGRYTARGPAIPASVLAGRHSPGDHGWNDTLLVRSAEVVTALGPPLPGTTERRVQPAHHAVGARISPGSARHGQPPRAAGTRAISAGLCAATNDGRSRCAVNAYRRPSASRRGRADGSGPWVLPPARFPIALPSVQRRPPRFAISHDAVRVDGGEWCRAAVIETQTEPRPGREPGMTGFLPVLQWADPAFARA